MLGIQPWKSPGAKGQGLNQRMRLTEHSDRRKMKTVRATVDRLLGAHDGLG